MDTRKIMKGIAIAGIAGAFALAGAGCTEKVAKADLDKALADKITAESQLARAQEASVGLVADKEKLQANVDALSVEKAQKDAELALLRETAVKAEAEVAQQEDAVVDNLALGAYVPETISSVTKVVFLREGTVYLGDEEYDYEETIEIPANTLQVQTSLTKEEFEDEPYLVGKTGMKYKFKFKDPVDVSKISSDNLFEIPFYGKEAQLSKVDSDSINLMMGRGYSLKVGESVLVEGKSVTLKGCSSDMASVDVDGVNSVVKEGSTKNVNGLRVFVTNVFNEEGVADDFATLYVGTDTPKSLSNGEEWKNGNEDWVFGYDVQNGKLNSMSVVRDNSFYSIEYGAMKPGDEMVFPDGFATLHFGYDEKPDYEDFKLEFDTISRPTFEEKVVRIKSSERILKADSEWVTDAYMNESGTFYIKDEGKYEEVSALSVINDEVSLAVSFNAGVLKLGDLELPVVDIQQFGAKKGEAEATDLVVGGQNLGSREEDVLLANGIVIRQPESHLDSDELVVSVPDRVPKMKITVSRA